MVKERISATVDAKTLKLIDKILTKGNYRNKSHVIEEAIEFLNKYEKISPKAKLELTNKLRRLNSDEI
tara:strand:- start:141 stop:344 length:204 start_codon:yes stop_codon:yes gene_type:complete